LRIIISSEDTDTTVIAVSHAFQIAATFERTLETVAAVDSKLKFCIYCGIPELALIDVFQIAHSLGMDLCRALPGMHAMRDCYRRACIPEFLAVSVNRKNVAVEKRDHFAMRIVNAEVAVIVESMLQKMRTRMMRKILILMAILTAVRISINLKTNVICDNIMPMSINCVL
jgi:hypothetical protein